MTSSEVWDEETAARYDTDAASHFEPEVLNPTVDLLERLAEGGPALEFAIGGERHHDAAADALDDAEADEARCVPGQGAQDRAGQEDALSTD